MKRFYTLAAVCAIAIGALAQPELTIPMLGNAPVIDGASEPIWEEIDPVYIDVEVDDDYGPATITEAWFKMAYDETAIYLLMYRDDDDLAFQWETGLSDWQSDRDEIFFDVHTDTLNDGRGASNEQGESNNLEGSAYGHYQFTSLWQANGAGDGAEETWGPGDPGQWYHNAPFQLAYQIDGNSYYTEYSFPFSSLTITALEGVTEFTATPGLTFGFEAVISDVDMSDNPTDENFRKFLRWADVSAWNTLDDAGRVTLGEEIISSTESITASGISVYPSPATSAIAVSGIESAANVEIINMVGHVVLSQSDVLSDTRIDISTLSDGVYLIRLDNTETVRFIKQ